MKISIVSYVYWPENFLINELAQNLVLKGHKVKVSTSLPNYQSGSFSDGYSLRGPYYENRQGVEIYRHPVVPRRRSIYFLTLNYASNILFGFLNLFRMWKTDVYFAFAVSPILNLIPAIIFKKITKKPLVVWYQDLWPDSFFAVIKKKDQGLLSYLLNFAVKFIYNNTDVMLIQNPMFAENLKRLGYDGKIHTVYNWAPSFGQGKNEQPDWMGSIPQDKFIITFAGNIGKVQGLESVIEAARRLELLDKEIFFLFVGDGNYLADLKKQAAGSSNILFAGRRPLSEMPLLFEKSDALLVSLARDKAFGLVIPSKLQAYMSAGKPILGFLDGAGAKVIQDSRCGLVAPAQDTMTFIEMVLKMKQQDSHYLLEYGRRGKAFFDQNFDSVKNINFIETVLSEVTRNHRA
ncbi:MAG: glycosyltransferase family 4 protein [Bdellovibrionaceae bacterium]|nr:glycosyltransferase family 4 protein [Pseudobdellovibrionaceae bacterium]